MDKEKQKPEPEIKPEQLPQQFNPKGLRGLNPYVYEPVQGGTTAATTDVYFRLFLLGGM